MLCQIFVRMPLAASATRLPEKLTLPDTELMPIWLFDSSFSLTRVSSAWFSEMAPFGSVTSKGSLCPEMTLRVISTRWPPAT